ncbi:hypothetical protein D9756_009509 [Leucocoprinus leucothites]|uniref:Uncharacterized protein n=1 Tax=Leucocoprinus leucothites TaxID=201217 RepID=A0A8H5CXJ0_9AGAR|nr:hypothetical protein D9756_009509 [Leucoagaricus leucothites]
MTVRVPAITPIKAKLPLAVADCRVSLAAPNIPSPPPFPPFELSESEDPEPPLLGVELAEGSSIPADDPVFPPVVGTGFPSDPLLPLDPPPLAEQVKLGTDCPRAYNSERSLFNEFK